MIDLHTHTTSSDGGKTPEELIDMAIEKNIKALAITDHDTVDSIERALKYAENKDIMIIPGIEFSTHIPKGQMHILGYFIDYKNKEFCEKIKFIKDGRYNRNLKYIEEYKKLGFDVTMDELKAVSDGKVIGKPHFAKVFFQKGYTSEIDDIYDKYFNQPPFRDIKKTAYTAKQIVEIIKNAGGIVVLAHPHSLELEEEELREKIKELKKYGIDGVEVYHSNHTPEQMQLYRQIAKENGLLITKGSDYHGNKSNCKIQLGTGKENNIINDEEDEILQELIKKSKEKVVYN